LLAYILAVAVIVLTGLLTYVAAVVLNLHGVPQIVLCVLIVLAGLGAAAAILVLHFRAKKRPQTESVGDPSELDALLNDATRKLRTSQKSGAKTFSNLPLLYVIGDANSAKTTTVAQSGLEPELIAGLAYRAGDVAPTPLINIWYTQRVALIEAGEAIRKNPGLLDRLVRRTSAKAYRGAFGAAAPARAVVACVSIENFLGPDAANTSLAAARTTASQLRQISSNLGTVLPVYVIFTKLDRVPHFGEYVRNLSNDEAYQVLGTTLPKSQASAGVYTDQATQDLGRALDTILFSLGEFRVNLLAREADQKDTAAVYEFPREFRKLRANLTQYLVELCKPSHLNADPYLRGFYFTGVRAQMIEQAVSTPATAPKVAPQDMGATRMFSVQEMRPAAQAVQIPAVVSHKAPQWTFLPALFPRVILGDNSALSATQQTAPARLFRRILFSGLAILLGIYVILIFVSYLNNSFLEKSILAAVNALPVRAVSSTATPSLGNLQTLDQLRGEIVRLDGFHQKGPPLMYRWGLYQGDRLFTSARQLYFDRFRQLFLNPAQGNFVAYLRSLPDTPPASADYTAAYNPLKAYLITTSNPEKSSTDFLTPVFMQYWINGRTVDSDVQQLARQQVNFYSSELLRDNPYSINPDTLAVNHARVHLSKFGAVPRIYQDMLTAAEKQNPSINFNRQYPGSSDSVFDAHTVPGAFTKSGFSFMQEAISHPERYFKGETWVLGDQATSSLDASAVTRTLTDLYANDYIKEWHTFLVEARVVGCGGLRDAPAKLNALTSPSSPLLALFYTVSHNTAVANPQIAKVFQPTQALVDPNAVDRFIGPGNTNYITALLTLSGTLTQVAQNPAAATDPAAGMPIHAAASAADIVARQTSQGFSINPMHTETTVLNLMQAPIKCADGLASGAGKVGIQGAGQKVCSAFNALAGKFPFSTDSQTQASAAEVAAFFAPETGVLWQTYNVNLKPLLAQQGMQYAPAPNAPFQITPGFIAFFNRATAISAGFFPPPAKTPELTFTLHEVPTKGIQSSTISVDAQQITGPNATKQFTWDASTAQQAQLSYNSGGALSFTGTWAVFKLFGKARSTRSAGITKLEFPVEISGVPVTLPDGTPEVVRFELSGSGSELLTPGALSGLRCTPSLIK
jgi:type VI secretion system protein ImpL